jgi:mono/diheme cytochrome c family protein
MRIRNLLGITLLALAFNACLYNNEEVLTGSCDTSAVKYSTEVAVIMDENCNGCHSTDQHQGGVVLDNYAKTVSYVKNGRLMGSILHKYGYDAMPKGASKLDNCSISKLKAWIDAGYPNN